MATLQVRNGSYRLLFQYALAQHSFTIGEVSSREAEQWKVRAEQLLMRIDQGLLAVPPGVKPADFIKHDGKAPPDPGLIKSHLTTFTQLRDAYLQTFSNGAIEASTLDTARKHLMRIEETLG